MLEAKEEKRKHVQVPCIYKIKQTPEGELLEVVNRKDAIYVEFVQFCPHIYKSRGRNFLVFRK